MTYPTIAFFLMMLGIGGIGVDLMRMERDRTHLQATLDRAVLAAADLDQQQDATLVVQDYLSKAGLGELYAAENIVTEEVLGYKRVSAKIESTFEAHLLRFSNGGDMPIYAASAAEESIGSVEISLVLDISGSMRSNNRLNNLKLAAHSFIDQITQGTRSEALSVSIIPYATQVNAGEALLSNFNADFDGLSAAQWNYSHCVNFVKDQFAKTTLSQTEDMERTAHFDPFTYSEPGIASPVCPTRDGSEILPLTNDPAILHDYIDRLQAGGNTSIDIGVKWGSALLDPSTRPVVNAMIETGDINANFAGRPADYNNGDNLKIIIVMSDGQNTNQYMLNPSRRTGPSEVWYNPATGDYSVYKSNRELNYYWPASDDWHDHPYGNGTSLVCGSWSCSYQEEPGEAIQLTYPQLFAQVSLAWNARFNYSFSSSAWSDWYQAGTYTHNRTAKDQHTKNICDRTKDQGVVIYSIGFEAPLNGVRVLQDCASSDAHYFDVDGLEISDAFASIATSIRKLRLTQ
ncbi:TadE/TadG family type IV pilus assembly protein [Pseudophaeobacter flagellatus]|uniref:TadE/TadG family type IV pilus assembly protein n=1 Tax=Pseudophaeobacter flagellatus TaxID=2899119 RepID=UPI001E448833|nr:TadE/TadG family type IV pilus assembly protein [Pseudophaeobacter flagellatus]MCD9148631.1 pilus assembly protein TadG-related protein [Pseudophaeobacter flagellatus]